MAATIKIKNSSTAGAAPTASDLVQGELAVNVTDKRLYTENASGTIVELGTNPSVPVTFPDGSASAPSLTNDGDTNTGIFFPAADTVGITTGGTERLRLDSSGNLGLGVTPSAWSAVKAMQIGTAAVYAPTSSQNTTLSANNYYDGSVFKYMTSDYASYYQQFSGQHRWYNAASGTAGNTISFTQAMTLDASGNLGVGATSPFNPGGSGQKGIEIAGSDYGTLYVTSNSRAVTGYMGAETSAALVNLGSRTNHPLVFATNNTERARIDSSGNLLVGTGGSNPSSSVAGERIGSTGYIEISRGSGTTSWNIMTFINGNGNVGFINTNGSSTSFVTSSDYRLKHDIHPMTGALDKVAALKPVTYKWNADNSDGEGFIAHELAQVCPHAVTGSKDAVDADGNPVYQGIDTSFLVATLTAAIQELKAIVDAQAAEIAALKG